MRYIKNDEIIINEIDDEIFMMDIEAGKYYGINAVGARIWTLLDECKNEDEIVSKLLKEYDIDEETCKNETYEFIQGLLDKSALLTE